MRTLHPDWNKVRKNFSEFPIEAAKWRALLPAPVKHRLIEIHATDRQIRLDVANEKTGQRDATHRQDS